MPDAHSEDSPPYLPAKEYTLQEQETISAALEILRLRMEAREVFASPNSVKDFLQLKLATQDREVFGVMYLDAQNRLIRFIEEFYGTLTQTNVYPRELVRRALALNAASVVLSHNHPSGTVEPSSADERLGIALKAALALVDVRVLDHVIVAPGVTLSMAEKGLI